MLKPIHIVTIFGMVLVIGAGVLVMAKSIAGRTNTSTGVGIGATPSISYEPSAAVLAAAEASNPVNSVPRASSSVATDVASSATSNYASNTASRAPGPVCNESLIGSDGYDKLHMITLSACKNLNALYSAGAAAGNAGDLYDNRDGLHVNLCVDWTPNPACPPEHRLFPQYDWLFSGAVGRATAPRAAVTVGQASWSGLVDNGVKYSIPHDMYRTQSGADELYRLYVNNNLYIYPSLVDDSFAGSPYSAAVLADPTRLDAATEDIANTPYVIASKQICDCGAGSLRIHDASGSDLPFVELAFAGLAAFKPSVKSALAAKGVLMSTLQSLVRYSYRDVTSTDSYLSSDAHRSMYMAHYVSGGTVKPAFDVDKLVSDANSLTLASAPPFVKMKATSDSFAGDEKLFDTPGAIARSVAYDAPARTITVTAAGTENADGSSGDQFVWRVLEGDPSLVDLRVDPKHPDTATITFASSHETQRIDVGVFARHGDGYYSVPGIVSEYVHE